MRLRARACTATVFLLWVLRPCGSRPITVVTPLPWISVAERKAMISLKFWSCSVSMFFERCSMSASRQRLA